MEAWLPPLITFSIVADWRGRKRDEQDPTNSEPYIAGYECDGAFSDQDAGAALKILEMLNAPASREDCTKELGHLKLLTKERAQGDRDMILQLAAMAEELYVYPLDIVRDACRSWATVETFFPSWAELRVLCEERVLKRRCLLNALRRHFGQKTVQQDGASASEQDTKGSPYNALWRSRRNTLEQAVGAKAFSAWLSTLTPVNPGSEATFSQLGAPTRFIRDWVDREYREVIENALERPVRIIHYNFSIEPAKRRASSRSDT